MTTRIDLQTQKRLGPQGPQDWSQLMSTVIQRAQALQDPRLQGLQEAMTLGKAEQALRRMGILTEVDLLREFPDNDL